VCGQTKTIAGAASHEERPSTRCMLMIRCTYFQCSYHCLEATLWRSLGQSVSDCSNLLSTCIKHLHSVSDQGLKATVTCARGLCIVRHTCNVWAYMYVFSHQRPASAFSNIAVSTRVPHKAPYICGAHACQGTPTHRALHAAVQAIALQVVLNPLSVEHLLLFRQGDCLMIVAGKTLLVNLLGLIQGMHLIPCLHLDSLCCAVHKVDWHVVQLQ
jgi:hypothetical protein